MNQNMLRNDIKQKRLALSADFIATEALAFLPRIQAFFKDIPAPQKIGIYLAAKGELDLTPSIKWLWQQGHHLYAPVIQTEALVFCEYQQDSAMKLNQFGIPEPDTQTRLPPADLDYVLVPLVAFDKQGHRIGMGKGYYDRTFAFRRMKEKPLLIGCGYGFQEADKIAVQAHDVSMDVILTSS
jgi:5-formyltetrahydrofolate cyclo-ligase